MVISVQNLQVLKGQRNIRNLMPLSSTNTVKKTNSLKDENYQDKLIPKEQIA